MDQPSVAELFKKFFAQPKTAKSPLGYVNHKDIKLYEDGDKVVEELKTFEVRDDDSWVVTYPKAGTTWVQEIMSCVSHDGDLETVNKMHTSIRIPFVEHNFPRKFREDNKAPFTHKMVEAMSSPRVIKSHLPGQLLPPQLWVKGKIVYVIRNPKDLVVSFYHFLKMLNPERKEQTFSEFFDEVMSGKVLYGPWWDHYLYFWKKRHEPNILLLKFEDLKKDLRGNVEKVSKFMGKDLPAKTLDAITDHCTFANMKKNPMTNPDSLIEQSGLNKNPEASFMRKGKVGDWRSHFTVAQNEAMDDFIRDKFHGTGLTFDQ